MIFTAFYDLLQSYKLPQFLRLSVKVWTKIKGIINLNIDCAIELTALSKFREINTLNLCIGVKANED